MTKTPRKKKEKPILPRAGGTMSEAGFWSFIRSALRARSRYWKPITQCKERAKRKYTGPNKRLKYVYLCSQCGDLYPGKEVAVHHSVEVGSLTCSADLPGFVERLFCEEKDLQVLCARCHNCYHNGCDEEEITEEMIVKPKKTRKKK